jgi:hypothetical protein
VCLCVIIFDGASEDVPNENLTLIKEDLSLRLSLSLSFSPYVDDKIRGLRPSR